jgi:hypothetical protein
MLPLGNMAEKTHLPDNCLLGLNPAQNILVFMGARPHFQVTQVGRSRGEVREMRNGLVVGLALGLAVLAGPNAYAFQEQNAPTAPAAAAEPQQAPVEGTAEKPLDLSDDTAAAKGQTGTEIRIPGLGKLGVLPKMDFGLELLYGAADQKLPEGPPEAAPNPDDDLMIRGTVKHRF